MSTRTQLRFVDADGNRVAQVYNHSDGYPSSIIPELVTLRDTLQSTGWVRTPEYAAAQFIFIRKMSGLRFSADSLPEMLKHFPEDRVSERAIESLTEETNADHDMAMAMVRAVMAMLSPEAWGEIDGSAYFLGGHGVEQGNIHGDEAFIYEVTVPRGPRGDGEWSVKVAGSADFPEPEVELRSGGTRGFDYPEGETAWDHAEWEYDGSLDDAVEEYAEE